jgi:hypothetical protein
MDINYFKKYTKPPIHISPRSYIITLICEKVKMNPDYLKNRMIIGRMVKPLSDEELTRTYELCKCGTATDSTDFKSTFFKVVKEIPKVKKPKQKKLL